MDTNSVVDQRDVDDASVLPDVAQRSALFGIAQNYIAGETLRDPADVKLARKLEVVQDLQWFLTQAGAENSTDTTELVTPVLERYAASAMPEATRLFSNLQAGVGLLQSVNGHGSLDDVVDAGTVASEPLAAAEPVVSVSGAGTVVGDDIFKGYTLPDDVVLRVDIDYTANLGERYSAERLFEEFPVAFNENSRMVTTIMRGNKFLTPGEDGLVGGEDTQVFLDYMKTHTYKTVFEELGGKALGKTRHAVMLTTNRICKGLAEGEPEIFENVGGKGGSKRLVIEDSVAERVFGILKLGRNNSNSYVNSGGKPRVHASPEPNAEQIIAGYDFNQKERYDPKELKKLFPVLFEGNGCVSRIMGGGKYLTADEEGNVPSSEVVRYAKEDFTSTTVIERKLADEFGITPTAVRQKCLDIRNEMGIEELGGEGMHHAFSGIKRGRIEEYRSKVHLKYSPKQGTVAKRGIFGKMPWVFGEKDAFKLIAEAGVIETDETGNPLVDSLRAYAERREDMVYVTELARVASMVHPKISEEGLTTRVVDFLGDRVQDVCEGRAKKPVQYIAKAELDDALVLIGQEPDHDYNMMEVKGAVSRKEFNGDLFQAFANEYVWACLMGKDSDNPHVQKMYAAGSVFGETGLEKEVRTVKNLRDQPFGRELNGNHGNRLGRIINNLVEVYLRNQQPSSESGAPEGEEGTEYAPE
jgi:hypothetical protein